MVWGVGFGDIVAGAELAYQIYLFGFTEENAADERYMIFQNEIFILHSLLLKLDEALGEAHKRYKYRHENRRPNLRVNAHDPVSDDFETERRHLVGDFQATLRECDALLLENRKYRTRFASFVDNLKWHLSQQEQRVDRLRQRIHFHCEKIRFVIDRLSINLLTDIDAKVDDLLAVSQQNLQVSETILLELSRFRSALFGHLAGHGNLVTPDNTDFHPIGIYVARRFQGQLHQDAPSTVQTGIPLTEGFDALLLHFDRSTDGSAPSADKYLAFLKTKWLLREIKNSEEFRNARPGLYYKRAVNQIAQAVSTKPRQSDDLIPYDESVLLGLGEASFRIWPPVVPLETAEYVPPHPLMAAAHEEQVLCLESESVGSSTANSITIFRSSPRQFRIVQQTTGVGLPGSPQLVPYLKESPPILCDHDKLIPRYAQPTITRPDLEVVISARGWEMPYKFASVEQLHRFQGALLGYAVSHSQERVVFEFDEVSGFGERKGRAQLWQEPIVLSSGGSQRQQPPSSPRSPSATSPMSGAGGPSSRHDSLAPSIATSTTINETADGWEAESIKSSALVIFTQAFDRRKKKCPFATLFLDLQPGIFIDHDECGCRVPMQQSCACLRIVLTRKKPGSDQLREFGVRVAYSDVDAHGKPNVNTFDLFPFRIPRHPDFRRLAVKKTKFFALKFPSVDEKRRFHDELVYRIRVREGQIKQQRDFDRAVLSREGQQRRHQRGGDDTVPNVASRVSSMASPALPPGLPPQLIVGSSGSDFAESVARGLDRFRLSYPRQELQELDSTQRQPWELE